MNKQQIETIQKAYEQTGALLETLGAVLATLPAAEQAGQTAMLEETANQLSETLTQALDAGVVSKDAFRKGVKKRYGVSKVSELSDHDAMEVVVALRKRIAKGKPPVDTNKLKAKPPVDIETPSETTQGLIDEADLLEEARRVTRAALKGNRVTRKRVESLLQDDFGVNKVSALQGIEVSRYIEELERLS